MGKPTEQATEFFGRYGGVIGGVYQLKTHKDVAIVNNRMGDCWMKGRLKRGDLLLCTRVSGDHFHSYILLKQYGNGWQGNPGSEFGAYEFALDPVHKVSKEVRDTLVKGETFYFEEIIKIDHTPAFLKHNP